jgi:hypothetical protein
VCALTALLTVAGGCADPDAPAVTDGAVAGDGSADGSADAPPGDAPTDQAPGDGAPSDAPSAAACTPDLALLAMPRRCLSDEHCACGAHCEYGRCVARCGPGQPMCAAGERCDRFGRCRSSADQDLVLAAAPVARGRVVTDSATVTLGTGGEQCPLVIRVLDRPTPRVRVVASQGLQVQCPGGTFAAECDVMSPPMNEPVSLAVRKDPAAPMAMMAEPGTVQLFGETSYNTVSVPPLVPPAAQPLEGTYTGLASLVGVQSGATAPSAAPPFRTEIPLRIRIFPGATMRVVELTDTLRALTSSATWVGIATNLSATPGPLTLARRRMVSVTPMLGTTASLSVRPITGTTLAVNPANGSLGGQLSLALEGVHPTKTPVFTWRLVLNRTGDLAPGAVAPAVSTDEAPTNAMALTTTRVAAETAVANTIPVWPGSRAQADFEQLLQSTGEVAMPTTRRFDACGGSPQIPLANWEQIARTQWGSPTRTFTGGVTKTVAASRLTDLEAPLSVLMAPYLASDSIEELGVVGWSPANLAIPGLSGVACAVEFGAQSATICPLDAPRTENYGTLDRCDTMARTLGCVPETITGGATVRLDGRIRASIRVGTSCTSSLQLNGRVTRVCRLRPTTPALCAEFLTCHDAANTTVANGFGAASFSPTVQPIGGDLGCGPRGVGIEAARRREAGSVPTNELITQCVADLGRLQTALPATATTAARSASPTWRCARSNTSTRSR